MINTTPFPMNNNNKQFNKPIRIRSKTMSLISQKNINDTNNGTDTNSNVNPTSSSNYNQEKNGFGMINKLKKMFSSRNVRTNDQTNNVLDKTNVQNIQNIQNIQNNIYNSSNRNSKNSINQSVYGSTKKASTRLEMLPNSLFKENEMYDNTQVNIYSTPNKNIISNKNDNDNIEWQPVYHNTCKIKLPVEEIENKKDNIQNELSLQKNCLNNSESRDNSISKNSNLNTQILKENEKNTQKKCLLNSLMCTDSSRKDSNQEEPYSKFKYYYNYYLVDEYLDSLAQSKDKKLNATGLNKKGELYENVNLDIKPILITKERLESGVPYDPQVVIM